MRIEIFNKTSGEVMDDNYYFVMDSKVWRDNGNSFESHSYVVNFDDFVEDVSSTHDWHIIEG